MFKLPTADLQSKRFVAAVAVRNLWDFAEAAQTGLPPRVILLGMQKKREKETRSSWALHCQPPPTEADGRRIRVVTAATVTSYAWTAGSCMETRRMVRRRRSCVAFGSLLPGRGRLHFASKPKSFNNLFSFPVVVAEPSHILKSATCYRRRSNIIFDTEARLLDLSTQRGRGAFALRKGWGSAGQLAARREGGSAKYFYSTRFRLCLFPSDLSLPTQSQPKGQIDRPTRQALPSSFFPHPSIRSSPRPQRHHPLHHPSARIIHASVIFTTTTTTTTTTTRTRCKCRLLSHLCTPANHVGRLPLPAGQRPCFRHHLLQRRAAAQDRT